MLFPKQPRKAMETGQGEEHSELLTLAAASAWSWMRAATGTGWTGVWCWPAAGTGVW